MRRQFLTVPFAAALVGTLVLAGAAPLASPLSAQAVPVDVRAPATTGSHTGGVFEQAFARNPFAMLLTGRWTFSTGLTASAGNNTLNVGDVWAINEIQSSEEGFRGSDLFLIAGLVPQGQGVQFSTHDYGAFTFTVPTPWAVFGVTGGLRTFGQGVLGDDISVLAREGFSGDTLVIDFASTSSRFVAFSDIGLLTMFELPTVFDMPAFFGGTGAPAPLRMRAGLGAHYLYGLVNTGLRFGAPTGGSTRVEISNEGVDADVLVSSPKDIEIGGAGFAVDGFIAANTDRLFLSVLVANLGSLAINTGVTEERHVMVQGATVGEFLDSLDAVQPVEVASMEGKVLLPMEVRAEASMELHRMLSVGLSYGTAFGGDFDVPRPLEGASALLEFRPVRFIPLRLGGHIGSAEYGYGPSVGFGLRFNNFRLDVDGTLKGGFTMDNVRAGAFRTSMALLF